MHDDGRQAASHREPAEVRISWLAVVICIAYAMVLLVRPDAWCPDSLVAYAAGPRSGLEDLIETIWSALADTSPEKEQARAVYFLLTAGLCPWLCMALLQRGRPCDIGLRRPNRYGYRWLVFGSIVALPFLWWMLNQPGVAVSHVGWVRDAGLKLVVWTSLLMLAAEHFFFHGVVLAVGRPGVRWPNQVEVATPVVGRIRRMWQWWGFAQAAPGASRRRMFVRWLGIPDGCGFAVLLSGVLFGVVHLGKNPRELLLSLPGGLFLGFLAFRSNSILVPFILHVVVAAAGTWMAFAMVSS